MTAVPLWSPLSSDSLLSTPNPFPHVYLPGCPQRLRIVSLIYSGLRKTKASKGRLLLAPLLWAIHKRLLGPVWLDSQKGTVRNTGREEKGKLCQYSTSVRALSQILLVYPGLVISLMLQNTDCEYPYLDFVPCMAHLPDILVTCSLVSIIKKVPFL